MGASYMDLVTEARRRITEISADQLASLDPSRIILIDVREDLELEQGRIPGAYHIPRGVLEGSIHLVSPPTDQPMVVYCGSGARSALAASVLQTMGYSNACSLAGGFQEWKARGGPWELPSRLPDDQMRRYDRHIRLPEIGEAGQRKLLEFACALIPDPDLVMLDEPAAGVSTAMVDQMKANILKQHSRGKTFLVVEHNMGVVMDISQRIIVLDHGTKIAEGVPKEIQENELVREAYFGR